MITLRREHSMHAWWTLPNWNLNNKLKLYSKRDGIFVSTRTWTHSTRSWKISFNYRPLEKAGDRAARLRRLTAVNCRWLCRQINYASHDNCSMALEMIFWWRTGRLRCNLGDWELRLNWESFEYLTSSAENYFHWKVKAPMSSTAPKHRKLIRIERQND